MTQNLRIDVALDTENSNYLGVKVKNNKRSLGFLTLRNGAITVYCKNKRIGKRIPWNKFFDMMEA